MKRPGKNRRIGGAVAVVFGFALAGACESQSSSRVGGETHWLDACDQDADCARGGCLCGVCTEPCGGDDSCAGETRRAGCFAVASPGLVDRCGAAVKAHGVCLALCANDADCPTGDQCHLGACVARTASGGDASTGEVYPPLPHASDFADVDAAMDLSKPVVLPPPSTTIKDAPDALLGTWSVVEAECNPATDNCVNLEFTKNGDGITGRMYLVGFGPPLQPEFPHGPFAPPTDPNVGYPTELDPARYMDVYNNAMRGPLYRLLDGVVLGNQLSFWYSQMDLWNDWCALQTPYEVTIRGAREFRCVDASANETNTDLGKLRLCRSAYDEDQCSTKDGAKWPCSCVEQQAVSCLPLDACSCTATGCSANVREGGVIRRADLALEGDTLKGLWTAWWGEASPIELRKVTP